MRTSRAGYPIPSIIGSQLGVIERDVISLPVRHGGLGIESPSSVSDDEYSRSKQITGPLAAIIALQGNSLPNTEEVNQMKKMLSIRNQRLLNRSPI